MTADGLKAAHVMETEISEILEDFTIDPDVFGVPRDTKTVGALIIRGPYSVVEEFCDIIFYADVHSTDTHLIVVPATFIMGACPAAAFLKSDCESGHLGCYGKK